MTPGLPMLGEFGVRTAAGLAAVLLGTSARSVPLAQFRTISLVMLGSLVIAGLFASGTAVVGLIVAGAVLAYLASITWGLGLPRVAFPLTGGILVSTLVLIALTTKVGPSARTALDLGDRLTSAWLMGAMLSAMLLGHHYLTAPSMSIDPLKRLVLFLMIGLALRWAVELARLAMLPTAGSPGGDVVSGGLGANGLFLAMRWGMGLIGPTIAAVLAWKTALIRSTQSATGILYIGMVLVLFGELTSILLNASGAAT